MDSIVIQVPSKSDLKLLLVDSTDEPSMEKINEIVKHNPSPKAGFLKGTFVLSPDFDEPFEDFKEYME